MFISPQLWGGSAGACHVPLALKNLQAWALHSLSVQPVSASDHLHSERVFCLMFKWSFWYFRLDLVPFTIRRACCWQILQQVTQKHAWKSLRVHVSSTVFILWRTKSCCIAMPVIKEIWSKFFIRYFYLLLQKMNHRRIPWKTLVTSSLKYDMLLGDSLRSLCCTGEHTFPPLCLQCHEVKKSFLKAEVVPSDASGISPQSASQNNSLQV